MTIDEAFKQLERGTKENRSTANKLLREALGLGIEALKREKVNRENPDYVFVGLLPGETEE